MVNGKPYISVNRAIINAEKAPKLRQSVLVCGLVKLKAKKINIAELSITSVPEAVSGFTVHASSPVILLD